MRASDATCYLCNNSIALRDVYAHFKEIHGIFLPDKTEAEATRAELLRAGTKEVLLRCTDA